METETIYHLYNHANGFENLFNDDEDYTLFLSKMVQHTSQIADIYSYCLMPNHFHLMLEIKAEEEILKTMADKNVNKRISRSFANLFAGFAKKINNKYSRMGSLFKQNFSSRIIQDENDFCGTVHYIHANPVHHGFVDSINDWKYSSYNSILSNDTPWLKTKTVIEYFGDLHEFIKYHQQPIELKIKGKAHF
jgi:REP element-mobilizing transposase RayT